MTDFEKIYKTYFNSVVLYIFRLSNNEYIAEEIASEAFFKALHSIESFRGDCDIRVWLCQIAKNCYYTYLKKTDKVQSIENFELCKFPEPTEPFEEKLFLHDDAMQIQKYLHEISEPYREVFMWRIFAELSYAQIGQIFGKSENWACVTYHRAKNMIKARLEANKNEK